MEEFDYSDTEAAHLGDIYSGFESRMSFEEEIAEAEYQRANTIATLAGLDDDYYTRQRERRRKRKAEIERKNMLNLERRQESKDLFVVIQDSRKDNTTLMLVDRRKSKEYWWTHDFTLAYKDSKENMEKVAGRLKKNNVRVVSFQKYFNTL